IAAGQSSTVTGTLAGQVVMEGFVHLRLQPVVRRLLTRAMAIVPAVITIVVYGERATGDLLVFSQVVLSLQLSFAVVPLVHLVADRRWMGEHRIGPWLEAASWLVALTIAALNLALGYQAVSGWMQGPAAGGWLLRLTVMALAAALIALLGYVVLQPIAARRRGALIAPQADVHGPAVLAELAPATPARRIAVAVDFSAADQ